MAHRVIEVGDPDEADPATQRLEPKARGVAVTGDLPMHSDLVTGIERGYRNDISGSSYYGEMRPAEPVVDDWASGAFPVAQARRLAGRDPAGESSTGPGFARASTVPPETVQALLTGHVEAVQWLNDTPAAEKTSVVNAALKQDAASCVASAGCVNFQDGPRLGPGGDTHSRSGCGEGS